MFGIIKIYLKTCYTIDSAERGGISQSRGHNMSRTHTAATTTPTKAAPSWSSRGTRAGMRVKALRGHGNPTNGPYVSARNGCQQLEASAVEEGKTGKGSSSCHQPQADSHIHKHVVGRVDQRTSGSADPDHRLRLLHVLLDG
jgi:hypothetical protein